MKAIIRKDLQKESLSMPIWKGNDDGQAIYVRGNGKRAFRWLNDTEGFQIKYRNKWFNAYSIDFDFI